MQKTELPFELSMPTFIDSSLKTELGLLSIAWKVLVINDNTNPYNMKIFTKLKHVQS